MRLFLMGSLVAFVSLIAGCGPGKGCLQSYQGMSQVENQTDRNLSLEFTYDSPEWSPRTLVIEIPAKMNSEKAFSTFTSEHPGIVTSVGIPADGLCRAEPYPVVVLPILSRRSFGLVKNCIVRDHAKIILVEPNQKCPGDTIEQVEPGGV